MIELTRQYGRYGYRRIAALLRDAGWHVNDKRVENRVNGTSDDRTNRHQFESLSPFRCLLSQIGICTSFAKTFHELCSRIPAAVRNVDRKRDINNRIRLTH